METPAFPDIYADALSVASGPFGVTVTLYLTEPPRSGAPQRAKVMGRVRLSPELAEALRAALASRDENAQPIEVGSEA